MFLIVNLLVLIATSYAANSTDASFPDIFPHYQFECDPQMEVYETEFSFLQGLGHGFVHAEPHQVYFEYYFPTTHWVAFATADQSIEGVTDQCSECYFKNYYPLSPSNKNQSNLYPICIEECLDAVIYVATVNSDQENINKWNIIEFQIASQKSKKLQKKMYRIPRTDEILQVWGNENYLYRKNAHFESDILQIQADQEFVHARFWRNYDFMPDATKYDKTNAWKPFVNGPYQNASNINDPNLFCFISVASFYGGAYPYDYDILHGLPGFYIDTENFANIHCYKRNDIKLDCGQETIENQIYDDIDDDTDLYFYDDIDDDTDIYDDTDASIDTTNDELDIIELDDSDTNVVVPNYNDNPFIKDSDFTVINFQTDWCIHCRRFRPEWDKAELNINKMIFTDENGNEITTKLLLVACESNLDVCSHLGIRAYPTIRMYNKDGKYEVYQGERKANVLLQHVETFIGSTDTKFKDNSLLETTDTLLHEEYDDYIEDDPNDNPVSEEIVGVTILKIVGVIEIVIFVIVCVGIFCCLSKRGKRSLDTVETMQRDDFGEGLVNEEISTLVTIGQQI